LLLEDVGQVHAGVLDEASKVVRLYCFPPLEGLLLDVLEKLVLHLERSSLRVTAKLALHLERPAEKACRLALGENTLFIFTWQVDGGTEVAL
jgi:hypothetical protein